MKIVYALQRASDGAWVGSQSNTKYRQPLMVDSITSITSDLARCIMNNPKFGEIRIAELHIDNRDTEETSEIGQKERLVKALLPKLQTKLCGWDIKILLNFVRMAIKNPDFRYAVETRMTRTPFDTKAAKKIAQFFKTDRSFLIKDDSNLMMLRLNGNFEPVMIYDIFNDEIVK